MTKHPDTGDYFTVITWFSFCDFTLTMNNGVGLMIDSKESCTELVPQVETSKLL